MYPFLVLLDLTILILATARLVRLVIMDDVGLWYLRGPASLWAINHDAPKPLPGYTPTGEIAEPEPQNYDGVVELREDLSPRLGWRSRLVSGLNCPFCVGFWIAVVMLLVFWLVGGPGHAHEAWRWVMGAFALNYAVAHLNVRAGDVDTYSDDDEG